MAAGIATLRNDDVGARGGRHFGLRQGLHLANDLASGRFDPPSERGGIADGQHHGRRPRVERDTESRGVALERPGDKADPDTGVPYLSELLADGRRAGLARADYAETAGSRDG